MIYNKYVAFGITGGAIRVTKPYREIKQATRDFFKEYPGAEHCTVRRVAVRLSGETVNDPEFEARRVSKINA